MSDDDAGALFGAAVLLAISILSGLWWLYAPIGVVFVACVAACIPAYGGGVPVYRREPDVLDEVSSTDTDDAPDPWIEAGSRIVRRVRMGAPGIEGSTLLQAGAESGSAFARRIRDTPPC